MRLPHPLLIALAAAVFWGASRIAAPPLPAKPEDIPTLAIPGSAFGSLAARTMRGSLYSYWHGGEAYQAPPASPQVRPPAANTPPPPPPPTPGVFARRRFGAQPTPPGSPTAPDQVAPVQTQPPPATAPVPPEAMPELAAPSVSVTMLDRVTTYAAAWLNALETRRTRSQDRAPMSAKHLRYINSSVGWRLRLAYNLDPGDPVLYEILHHHIVTTTQDPAQARERSKLLAQQALEHAHSSQAGMADSLTGFGAAINAFNETATAAQPGQPAREELLANWQDITSCRKRFHEFRSAAGREGWWKNIPEGRRVEIDTHAKLLDTLTKQIQEFLTKNGILISRQ